MYTTRIVRLSYILPSSLYSVFITLIASTVVYVLYAVLGYRGFVIPIVPIMVIGTAVSFYVGFKNNSSYDRMWEARRIWGSITNASRMWGAMVNDLVIQSGGSEAREIGLRMVHRHIAWCNALRLQLRRNKVWSEKYYQSYSSNLRARTKDNYEEAMHNNLHAHCDKNEADHAGQQQNIASHLLHLQNRDLKKLKSDKVLDNFEHSDMGRLVLEFYNQQGAAERIKGYPFPRQYAIFSRVFVDIFCFILPFGLIVEVEKLTPGAMWLLIPVCLIVSWIFNSMEQVGDFSENPFENAVTDIPISAICRNIEIDLKEMIGEKELPPRLQPENGILM